MDLGEIRDTLSFLDDWEDRYRYIIDLGKSVDSMPEADRTESNLVRGCQSQVWLVCSYDQAADRMTLRLDSDAHIVRGLIAIVLQIYNGKSPVEIVSFDIEQFFKEIDLLAHLSAVRGNGLRSMVAKIVDTAKRSAVATNGIGAASS